MGVHEAADIGVQLTVFSMADYRLDRGINVWVFKPLWLQSMAAQNICDGELVSYANAYLPKRINDLTAPVLESNEYEWKNFLIERIAESKPLEQDLKLNPLNATTAIQYLESLNILETNEYHENSQGLPKLFYRANERGEVPLSLKEVVANAHATHCFAHRSRINLNPNEFIYA